MQSRGLITLSVALLAIFATTSVSAQLYKWVDERGVTNYSNQPPADPKAAKKLVPIEDRVSVYTPDKTLTRAIEVFRRQSDRALADKVSSLESQLEAERQARQYVAATAQTAYDPCPASGGIDCNGFYSGYNPYPFAFVPIRHRFRTIVGPQIPPGTIAGNVVGMNGFIPGNSAAAFVQTASASRILRAAPRSSRLTVR